MTWDNDSNGWQNNRKCEDCGMNYWLDGFRQWWILTYGTVNSQLWDSFLTRLYGRCFESMIYIFEAFTNTNSDFIHVWLLSCFQPTLLKKRVVPESGLSGSAPSHFRCRSSASPAAGWWRRGFSRWRIYWHKRGFRLSAMRPVGFGTAGMWCRLGSNFLCPAKCLAWERCRRSGPGWLTILFCCRLCFFTASWAA